MTKRPHGFTLIELMIVVAIIGILSTWAYSSYQDSIRKANRAAAKAELLKAQQWMERFYSENFSYSVSIANTAVGGTAGLFVSQFSTAPPPGEGRAAYNITLSNLTSRSFTVTATRIAAGPAAGDACGDFNLSNTGRKTVTNYSASNYATALAAARECWR